MFANDKALQVFNFKSNDVRVVMDDQGEPWFVLRDVLKAQGSATHTTQAISAIENGLGEGYVNVVPLQTVGGIQKVRAIATPAVTFLVSRSNTLLGRELNRWIHADVLPAIRKHGGYLTPSKMEEALLNPDVLIRLATDLKEERARRIEAEEEIAIMAPKVDVYDAHYGKSETITDFVRTLDGVNTMRTKADLAKYGYLYRVGNGHYRVYHQFRGPDKLFIEKVDPLYGSYTIYVTPEGAKLLVSLYKARMLTMRKGWF